MPSTYIYILWEICQCPYYGRRLGKILSYTLVHKSDALHAKGSGGGFAELIHFFLGEKATGSGDIRAELNAKLAV